MTDLDAALEQYNSTIRELNLRLFNQGGEIYRLQATLEGLKMNQYPKMLYKSERTYNDSALVAQALSSKEIATVIVVDETAEIEKMEEGFVGLAALMAPPKQRVTVPAGKGANGAGSAA